MKKEYRVIYFQSLYFYFSAVLLILYLYGTYDLIKNRLNLGISALFLLCVVLPGIIFGYYMSKIAVTIDDDTISIKRPYKVNIINFKNIYKIERVFGWGTFHFDLYYEQDHKKRTETFPDAVKGYKEVIAYLEQKTGLKVKWGL